MKSTILRALAGALALALALPMAARAADNLPAKDGLLAPFKYRALDLGSTIYLPLHADADPTGVPYSSSYGKPVSQQGTWTFGLTGPIPAGSNVIGGVTISGTVPLPTGAATAAAQATGNAALGAPTDAAWDGTSGSASITAILKGLPRSVGGGGGGGAATIADGADVAQGARADAAWSSGSGSVIAILKALAAKIDAVKTSIDSGATASLPAGTNTIGAVTVTPPGSIATGQVTCATTSTLVVAARTGRRNVAFVQEGTTAVRLGPSGVTTSSGVLLTGTVGTGFTIDGSAAVYCTVASGTQTISFVETY